jgi:plasmid stability protein
MATLKDLPIPDELLARIELRAKVHGVSVEEQVVRDLSALEDREGVDEERLLSEIRREREEMAAGGVYLTDELLREAKHWGRE